MTDNTGRTPKPPPHPRPQPSNTLPPTEIELWTLECLTILTRHYKRAPTIVELAAYCRKATSPVYKTLTNLEGKGYVVRVMARGVRHGIGRFHAIDRATGRVIAS